MDMERSLSVVFWGCLLLTYGTLCSSQEKKQDVNILVLLPMQASNGYFFPFGMEMCGGAVYRAVDDIKKSQLLSTVNLNIDFENSGCNAIKGIDEGGEKIIHYPDEVGEKSAYLDNAVNCTAYSLLHRRNYTAIIGPSCSEVCKMVARLAVYLNKPCYSSLCQDIEMNDKNHFQTLTRLQGTFEMTGSAVGSILRYFSWNRVGILASKQVDIIWLHTRRGLHYAFERMNITIAKSTLMEGEEGLEQYLVETAKVSRIIILAMLGSTFRKTMLLIHKHGLDNGDYIFLSTVYYSQRRHFGYYGWDYGDENDELVKNIFRSVFFISYYVRREDKAFSDFENSVKNFSSTIWNYHYAEDEDVPYPAANLHESVMLLARALNETIQEGGDITDGRSLARKTWGRSFPSLTGGVSMSNVGDRDQAYMISHLQDVQSGKIEIVANFFYGNNTLAPLVDRIVWPSGLDHPPPDTPECGFEGELCVQDPSARLAQIIGIFSGVLVATMIIASVVIFYVYRYMQSEREIADMKWKIDPHEVKKDVSRMHSRSFTDNQPLQVMLLSLQREYLCFHAVNNIKSTSRSNMSLKSIQTNASGTQIFAETGFYKGIRVAIKSASTIRNVDLGSRKLLSQLKRIHDLAHPNLVRFIGASIELKGVRLYTEYCMKGGLQDVLENSEIQLDWPFKCSLMLDIIEGLSFIQDSFLKFHGNLKSSSCLVDGRFVVKLNNFGMREWRRNEQKKARALLWTASEHLRSGDPGSVKGDIYSLGIILQEIVAREGVFFTENPDLSDEDKLTLVKQTATKPFRPTTNGLDCPAAMRALMEKCWAEEPATRPNIHEVKSAVKKASGLSGQNLNIMDNLLQRMEQYANNLEDLVEERTGKYLEEKKKAEDLLHRLLPPSVADELQQRGAVDPVSYDSVTIYFSDIVSFTPICSRSTPFQVVTLLNDLYTLFDGIIAKYDVYKVETIGDAYMTVSGLPKANGNRHVREIGLMALALLHSVKSFSIRHSPTTQLLLRIGLHTGSCVAGVVGLTMPRYCLFGDTVNTASRMESNGEALKIHISPDTKDALREHEGFEIMSRGKVFIKGKGDMETFWLVGGPEKLASGPTFKSLDKTPAAPTSVEV